MPLLWLAFALASAPAFAQCGHPGEPRCATASASPAANSSAVARAPTAPAANAPPAAADWSRDRRVAWLLIAAITLLATAVALYPVLYYIFGVWPSRQKAIFNTLTVAAKAEYMRLYHATEEYTENNVVITEPGARFSAFYSKWFGRGALGWPTLLIAILLLAYSFLAAIAAAKATVPLAVADVANVSPIAIAAVTGAYILVSLDTIARVTQRDLLPDDLYLSALRLAAAIPLGMAFASLASRDAQALVALAITAFPLQQLAAFLRQIAARRIGIDNPSEAAREDSPIKLSGVDRTVCERLSTVGVNTITQLAYGDPIQLTMRTSLGFVFVLDIVSQALAWVYLESKLNDLRPMGLRGAWEISVLYSEANDATSAHAANSKAVIEQLPAKLGLTKEQVENVLHQIADDAYVGFLVSAYSE